MKKILSVLLFVAMAFVASAQFDVSDPIIICGAGEACEPNINGHFLSVFLMIFCLICLVSQKRNNN